VVKAKVKCKKKNFRPIFDYILSKYVNQKTESRDRSLKDSASPSLKHDRSRSHRSGYVSNVIKIGSMDVTINNQVDNKILDHEASNKSLASEYMRPPTVYGSNHPGATCRTMGHNVTTVSLCYKRPRRTLECSDRTKGNEEPNQRLNNTL
jgi:hypothetical protein